MIVGIMVTFEIIPFHDHSWPLAYEVHWFIFSYLNEYKVLLLFLEKNVSFCFISLQIYHVWKQTVLKD